MRKKENRHKIHEEATRTEWGSVMAFLQARMGSTRLPGKVLMPIREQTILARAIRRLAASPAVDDVVVLTTELPEDDAVEREALETGAKVFRGSESDVLERFQKASEKFGPDIVIRATADNPLIDIGSMERIVQILHSDLLDLCMEQGLPYGAATEAVRAEALTKSHAHAREARHREHVTLYIKENPRDFHVAYPKPPDLLCHPDIRVTVDTIEDYRHVARLIGMLPEGARPVSLHEYIPLVLVGRPEVRSQDPRSHTSASNSLAALNPSRRYQL